MRCVCVETETEIGFGRAGGCVRVRENERVPTNSEL